MAVPRWWPYRVWVRWGLTLMARPAQPGHLVLQEARGDQHAQLERQALQGVLHQLEERIAIQGELDHAAGASLGTAGCVGSGLWEPCRFASARFKAVPPSSSWEKPRPV